MYTYIIITRYHMRAHVLEPLDELRAPDVLECVPHVVMLLEEALEVVAVPVNVPAGTRPFARDGSGTRRQARSTVVVVRERGGIARGGKRGRGGTVAGMARRCDRPARRESGAETQRAAMAIIDAPRGAR